MALSQWSINISDTYIVNSIKPIKFNDVIVYMILGVRETENKSVNDILRYLINTGKFAMGPKLSVKTNGQEQSIRYSFVGKTIKYIYKTQVIIFTDDKYELTYNVEKDFLSIIVKNDNMLFYWKDQIKNVSRIYKVIGHMISGLCGNKVESSVQDHRDINSQVDAKIKEQNDSIDTSPVVSSETNYEQKDDDKSEDETQEEDASSSSETIEAKEVENNNSLDKINSIIIKTVEGLNDKSTNFATA